MNLIPFLITLLNVPVFHTQQDEQQIKKDEQIKDTKTSNISFTYIRLDSIILDVCGKEYDMLTSASKELNDKYAQYQKIEKNPKILPKVKQSKMDEIKALINKRNKLDDACSLKTEKIMRSLSAAVDRAMMVESEKNPAIMDTIECKIFNIYTLPNLANRNNKNVLYYDITETVTNIISQMIK